jgi:hypothetical protein
VLHTDLPVYDVGVSSRQWLGDDLGSLLAIVLQFIVVWLYVV